MKTLKPLKTLKTLKTLEENHCAALGVERKPLHLEVTQPFHGVGDLVADHVGSSVEEVSVVKGTFLGLYKAEVGVRENLPDLVFIRWSVFRLGFDVVEDCPRLPKQASVFRIYSVEFGVLLNVLKGNLLVDPFSRH